MAVRFHHRIVAGLMALAVGAWLLDARADDFVGPPAPDGGPFDDPFPIRRVLLPKDRLTAELNRVEQGIFVRLAREEFEKRVRQAARAVGNRPEPPRLVEAHYRASLRHNGLNENSLFGTAEWKIIHNQSGPGLLPLDSMRIALREARWTDNRPAIIGLLDARPAAELALLVEAPGEQALSLDWSARGLPSPGELRFDLMIPASPIASLDLELPADVKPVLPQRDVMLAGPFPVDAEGKRNAWRIAFGSLSRLEVSLRPVGAGNGPTPPMQASLATRLDLVPGLLSGQYAFEFKVLRGEVSDFLLEHDAELTPTDVVIQNLESWRSLPGTVNGRKRIHVRLRDPARGGQLRISAMAPIPFSESVSWTSPSMQIVGAILRGESLRLHLAPEMKLIEWRSGSFRMLKSEFRADRSQLLTLESALLPDGQATPIRPSANFRPANTEFFVHQRTEWEIRADRSHLTTRIELDVRRGKLSQLDIRFPAGWDVNRVEAGAGPTPVWSTQGGPSPILRVEMPRPLTPGNEGQIVVRFHQPGPSLGRDLRVAIPFPDAVPVGARSRDGEYRVNVSPAYLASAPQSSEEVEVFGPQLPDLAEGPGQWFYRFHGRPPGGPLYLVARTPRFSAIVDNEVSLAAGQPIISTRLELKPESGSLTSILIFTTEPVLTPWIWRTTHGTNRVVSMQPLEIGEVLSAVGSLGAQTPLGVPLRLQAKAKGRWHRMNFARPLDGAFSIASTYGVGASDSPIPDQRLIAIAILGTHSPLTSIALGAFASPDSPFAHQPLPLIRILGAASVSGTVAVNLREGEGRIVETTGLIRELSLNRGAQRRDVYRLNDRAISLVLRGEPPSRNEPAARVDGAEITVVADPSGIWRCHYRFQLRGWQRGALPVRLPKGAEPIEIAVAGEALSADRCRTEISADHTVCSFPVSGGDVGQRIEILFSVPAPQWSVASHLTAPILELPIALSSVRTVWRLPPGVVPIALDGLTRLPGGPTRTGRWNLPWIAGWFGAETDSRDSFVWRSTSGKGQAPNAKTLLDALLGPDSPIEKPIVDTAALAEAELHSATPVQSLASGAPNWESLGLVIVPFPGGLALTTPRHRSIWRADAQGDGTLPLSIQIALIDAHQNGRDASGRFRSVADWAESFPNGDRSTLLPHLGGNGVGWTDWEMRDANDGSRIEVVNTAHVASAGWLMAAVLAAIGIVSLGRLGRFGAILLLCWLLGAGCALIWLPTALSGLAIGPMLSGLLIAAISACRRRSRSKEQPTVVGRPSTKRPLRALSATRALSILFVLSTVGRAGVLEPATVYLLAGPESNSKIRDVLVSPEVLDRLAHLAKPQAALNEAVIYRARYTGRVENSGQAEFEARFDLMLFADRTIVDLPLGDVRLREALLDGAAAFPTPLGKERCAFEIKGRGEHRLDLKFSVTATGNGFDRDVRFGTPETANCQITFTAPKGAEPPHAANWNGAQNSSADGRELKADLGRTQSVHIRWGQAGKSTIAQVGVRETAVWDIAPAGATLYSAFDYRITQGGVSSFQIALPPDVEVSRLEVRPESAALGAPESWIRDWRIGPNRVLSIDLQGALTGSVRLLLEGISAKPLNARPELLYPAAVDVAERESFVAFRLHVFDLAAEFPRRGVTGFSTESFLRDYWRTTGAEKLPAPVTRAYRRLKNESISLRPELQVAIPVNKGSQEIVWQFGPDGTEVRGTARWRSTAEPLSFVELEITPVVIVGDVRGLRVQSWLRAGNKVLVWLREPAAEVVVVWYGSLPRGKAAIESSIVELPPIRLDGTASQTLIQRLRTPAGWTLTPDNPASLGASVPPLTNRELAFQSTRLEQPSRFHLRGPQADAIFRIMTSADVEDRRINIAAHIDPSLRLDRPHSFSIVVDDAEGWELDLRLPVGSHATARPGNSKMREWRVDIPPRDREFVEIVVAMNRPLFAVREFTLPEITIQHGGSPTNVKRHYLLLGPEIRAMTMLGLLRAPDLAEITTRWPRERERLAERGGTVWQSVGGETRANVLASPGPIDPSRAGRLILTDIEAALVENRWMFRARIDLLHESGAEIICILPRGSRLDGWALNGVCLPLPTDRERFNVPLPIKAGSCLLEVVWSADEPIWDAPILESAGRRVPPGPTLWTANAPAGHRIDVEGELSAAAIDIRRAKALLRLADEKNVDSLSAESMSKLIADAARWVRLAEASSIGKRTEAGEINRLKERLVALRSSMARPDIPLSSELFADLPNAERFRMGVPVHWAGSSGSMAGAVRIEPVRVSLSLPVFASFGLLAAAVAVLGMLMIFAGRFTRPEQIVAIGVIGFAAFGIPQGFVFLALSAIGILLRGVWGSRRAIRWSAR